MGEKKKKVPIIAKKLIFLVHTTRLDNGAKSDAIGIDYEDRSIIDPSVGVVVELNKENLVGVRRNYQIGAMFALEYTCSIDL